jgi:hypothetical protein
MVVLYGHDTSSLVHTPDLRPASVHSIHCWHALKLAPLEPLIAHGIIDHLPVVPRWYHVQGFVKLPSLIGMPSPLLLILQDLRLGKQIDGRENEDKKDGH